jgi:hypothetical protein
VGLTWISLSAALARVIAVGTSVRVGDVELVEVIAAEFLQGGAAGFGGVVDCGCGAGEFVSGDVVLAGVVDESFDVVVGVACLLCSSKDLFLFDKGGESLAVGV